MTQDLNLSSTIIRGSKKDSITFDQLYLCISRYEYNPMDTLSDFISVSYYNPNEGKTPISLPPQEKCKNLTIDSGSTFCACFNREDNLTIDTSKLVLFEVDQAKFSTNQIQYTLVQDGYDFDRENRTHPLEVTRFMSRITTNKDSITWQAKFDKIIYEIDNNYFYAKKNVTETYDMASLDQTDHNNAAYKTHVTVQQTGTTMINTRTVKKITEIFAAVSGLQGLAVLIVTVVFSNYFEFKFYENLYKEVKGSAIKVGYLAYLRSIIAGWLGWQSAFKIRSSESEVKDIKLLKQSQAQFEDMLDVINYCRKSEINLMDVTEKA